MELLSSKELSEKLLKVEELCELLLGYEDVPATGWMKAVNESIQSIPGVSAYDFSDTHRSDIPILHQLLHLLRECLLNQSWTEALKVLQSVVKVPQGTSYAIWKVGTELQGMENEGNRDLIQQLSNQMRLISDLNSQEVVLDFMSYLLSVGENEEAVRVLQEVKKRQGRKKEKEEVDYYMEKLHVAYLGLLWYLEWKRCLCLQSDFTLNDADGTLGESLLQMSQQQSVSTQMVSYRDKAIACFNKLRGEPGVWDMFVTKYAELQLYSDKVAEAVDILKEYRDSNPDNLNAHKYLYMFCREHCPEKEDLKQQLKTIAEMSPSDGLVLQLCEELQDEPSVAVAYLFKLLDYSCWQQNSQAWGMLAEFLTKIYKHRSGKSRKEREVVKECWDTRESWWPAYQFSSYRANSDPDSKGQLLSKTIVASLLCGKDCEFVKIVSTRLDPAEMEKLPQNSTGTEL